MKRDDLIPYIAHCLDDALSVRRLDEMPYTARIVGWQCGFEPLCVAVWSYLGVRLDASEAEEIAADYLDECGWFADGPTPADFVL